jgi:hypothetical protein
MTRLNLTKNPMVNASVMRSECWKKLTTALSCTSTAARNWVLPNGSSSMSALLSPVQDGKIWRVKIVWPNQAVHHFGKFTSEQDAIDWINAHPRLTKPEDTMDEPQIDL